MDEINAKLDVFEETWIELEMALRNVFKFRTEGKKYVIREVYLKDIEDRLIRSNKHLVGISRENRSHSRETIIEKS